MRIKLFFATLVGFAVGVVAMWLVVKQTTVKVIANQYLLGVMDQANVALHIRAGKQMTLVTNIEAALPGYVLAVEDGFKGYAGATNALWMVRAYYQRNEIPVPDEIKGILERLPEKPPAACQVRLRALEKTSPTDATAKGDSK